MLGHEPALVCSREVVTKWKGPAYSAEPSSTCPGDVTCSSRLSRCNSVLQTDGYGWGVAQASQTRSSAAEEDGSTRGRDHVPERVARNLLRMMGRLNSRCTEGLLNRGHALHMVKM